MPAKSPEPLLRTPDDQLGKEELIKLDSNHGIGHLDNDFADMSVEDIVKESEFLAKAQGIYLEYNRAKSGREKDWMYMVRCSIPGGGSFTADQWRVFDSIADKYCDYNPFGTPSIRLTTRQNVQYHWVPKRHMRALIQDIASTGYYSLNGCGDNVRNVMGCPLSKFSTVYDANAKAHEYGAYFRLPAAPHIQIFAVDPAAVRDAPKQYDYSPRFLNRKFKVAFSALHRDPDTGHLHGDNCVELLTHDLGVAPVPPAPGSDKVEAYMVYIGGGQGEKNGKPSFARHALPLGLFAEADLMKGLHDIVKVHEEWGDRKNRVWARMKYVVHKQGIDWYRDQVRARGSQFDEPIPDFDPGPRLMHHGWTLQETNNKWAYGAYIECGRLVDSPDPDADPDHQSGNVTGNGNLKAMVRETLDAFPGTELLITPNQDLVFTEIDEAAKEDFTAKLAEYGFGKRKGKTYSTLRVLSGSCVGLPTCRLSYTDSEQFEPELLDELDARGYGDLPESIGITGCERQCFRPATKTIGWVGQGPDRYGLKLGGSEDGRHQGTWLLDPEGDDKNWVLRQVPRDKVADVTIALFELAKQHGYDPATKNAAMLESTAASTGDMGAIFRRLGAAAVIAHLKTTEGLAELFEKALPSPFLPDGPAVNGTN
ncbi:MAG: nitrite/sulfite reductase [Planctomycetota bacterium]